MEEENDVVVLEHPPPYQDSSSSAIVPPVQQVAPTMQQPFLRAGDAVLAVMGVTGAGKSTFVSLLSPDKDVEIGHDLRSSERDRFLFVATR
jgi:ABC-type protease/lipase transport system fused ATPase/permease subunit